MAGLTDRFWKYGMAVVLAAVVALVAIAIASGGEGSRNAPAATGTAEQTDQRGSGEGLWSAVRLVGSDRLFAPTLTDLARQSDVGVLGTLTNLRVNRVVEADVPDQRFVYGVADLQVERVLAGELDRSTDTIGVEFTIAGASYEDALANLRKGAADLPQGKVVAFLISVDREVGRSGADVPEQQRGLYIPHSSYGLFATTSRAALDTPLGDAPTEASHPYATDLKEMTSVDQLAERFEEIAG